LIPSLSLPIDEIPKREIPVRGSADGFSLVIRRNCSISPAGFAGVLLGLAAAGMAIGGGFAAAGAWLVLPFAGVEAVLLGAAFLAVAHHASDRERIELERDRLRVEIVEGGEITRADFDRRWTKVRIEQEGGVRVMIGTRRKEVEVGRHLDARSRIGLADELRRRLGN
jgi:uncharacterized membrane protein